MSALMCYLCASGQRASIASVELITQSVVQTVFADYALLMYGLDYHLSSVELVTTASRGGMVDYFLNKCPYYIWYCLFYRLPVYSLYGHCDPTKL